MKQTKKRNWAIVAYPESLPENWEQTLIETGLPISISPLHDADVNEGTGELKKPHYHIILCYPGPTTFNTVNELAESLNAPIPKPIESVKGAYRYQTHQDNPEKAQYKKEDIKNLNGFDPADFIELTSAELRKLTKKCLEIIEDKGLYEYADLVDLLNNISDEEEEIEAGDLFDFATSHTVFLNNYLKSRRYKAEKALKALQDTPSKLKKVSENHFDDVKQTIEDLKEADKKAHEHD